MLGAVGIGEHLGIETEKGVIRLLLVDDLSVPVFTSPDQYWARDPVLTFHL